jgi:hypothetical protein
MASGKLVAHVRMHGNAANVMKDVCSLACFHANGNWYS